MEFPKPTKGVLPMSFLRRYRWDLVITAILFTVFAFTGGLITSAQFVTLVVLEVSLSFDNAIVNAMVLRRLSHGWQKAFIWVGIWIAVFGMRFAFPLLIVMVTAGMSGGTVIDLALHNPTQYAVHLTAAHPEIATLGGVYLGMIFLNYFLGEHESFWLGPVERFLVKVGRGDVLSAAIMLGAVLIFSQTIGGDEGNKILLTGVIAMVLYLVVQVIGSFFESDDEESGSSNTKVVQTGIAGLGLFIYLEVQDAAFSFDGVSGAFAITNWIPLIMAGLGVGALFVRSMTVHLVETDKIAELPYLENGAHWAIGALAVCIFTSLYVEVPEWVTGPLGAIFVIASVISSIRFNRAQARSEALATA